MSSASSRNIEDAPLELSNLPRPPRKTLNDHCSDRALNLPENHGLYCQPVTVESVALIGLAVDHASRKADGDTSSARPLSVLTSTSAISFERGRVCNAIP